jgi:hypothetical protein
MPRQQQALVRPHVYRLPKATGKADRQYPYRFAVGTRQNETAESHRKRDVRPSQECVFETEPKPRGSG